MYICSFVKKCHYPLSIIYIHIIAYYLYNEWAMIYIYLYLSIYLSIIHILYNCIYNYIYIYIKICKKEAPDKDTNVSTSIPMKKLLSS